jgi:hypothetical protein
MMYSSHLTDFGLREIRLVPYGLQACHFYDGAEDLEGTLVQYFAAGLRKRERIWIMAAPPESDARQRWSAKSGVDLEAEQRRGALIFKDYSEWYSAADGLKGVDVVRSWLAEEKQALADGFNGLRISGNPASSPANRGRCSLLDVARCHDCIVDGSDQGWQVLSPETGRSVGSCAV